MYISIRFLLALLFVSVFGYSEAQTDTTAASFGGIIYLDSLVVTASRQGFKVEEFIDMVRQDSSFYQAFHNLRFLTYESGNDIRFFNKKDELVASSNTVIQQYADGDCRTMEYLSEKVTGNYYKRKKKPRYFTARMYEKIFYTKGRICESEIDPTSKKKGLDKYVEDLKVLIFQPGSTVDVPLIGKKTRIFSPALSRYYDFSIRSRKYKSAIDCYVFSAKVKEQYLKKKADKTIIRSLETYFDKETFAVVARQYHLYYRGAVIDFDASIDIELRRLGSKYVPEWLQLEGVWKVPFKSRERTWFETSFYNFRR